MSDLGELVLIIGDFHSPSRAADLPQCFSELLNTDKIRTVLCTGSLGSPAILERIRGLGQTVHIVKGISDTEEAFESLPDQVVTTVGKFKIGLIGGHQVVPLGDKTSLEVVARKLEIDILISGATHQHSIVDLGGRYLINPGSATGAFSGADILKPNSPAFMLMAVQGDKAVVYVYEEHEGKTNVVMSEISKKN